MYNRKKKTLQLFVGFISSFEHKLTVVPSFFLSCDNFLNKNSLK